ncbi:aminopeptidase PepB [Aliikangiella maris]|uniref:Aminopeptidase PepB n=2 Tax=Aliikangiella maris TaxID=3162458 RepID=A0ABV2BRE0_9GAMM
MNQTFQVLLSSSKLSSIWGEEGALSFHESGATIHIESLTDSPVILEKIQKAARQIASMNVPRVSLVGNWPLEAQWHFWQGAYSPKPGIIIDFAQLPADENQILNNRVTVLSWVRQLINQTPEELSPVELAVQSAEFIKQFSPNEVSYRIISGEELAENGYTGIFSVGRGSDRPPAMLQLEYTPAGWTEDHPAAALVGKGITFDSGGYSLKASTSMLHMKSDMGGAATVAGALALSIANGLHKKVNLYLCCAENLVSGHAYKLADILKYRNNVSVEIVNTDAEGRIVLADGLIDASNSGAPIIIDAATLTGAAVVAVGVDYNAIFSMDDELATQFSAVAEGENDLAWRLPLTMQHRNKCPSPFADTANSRPQPGGGTGAASNAAGFLSRFVKNPETGWLHVDLAACYKDSPDSLWSAGATGRGVRSIAAFLNQL